MPRAMLATSNGSTRTAAPPATSSVEVAALFRAQHAEQSLLTHNEALRDLLPLSGDDQRIIARIHVELVQLHLDRLGPLTSADLIDLPLLGGLRICLLFLQHGDLVADLAHPLRQQQIDGEARGYDHHRAGADDDEALRDLVERQRLGGGDHAVAVERQSDQVVVTLFDGHQQRFDDVILACHSDQALALLRNPSADERAMLAAIPYQSNQIYLHRDRSLMPNRRAPAR